MATGRFADESEAIEAPLNAAMVEDLGLDDGEGGSTGQLQKERRPSRLEAWREVRSTPARVL